MFPEMRKAVRKLEQYTAEANLICKYKLETLKDVKSYKEKSIEKLRNLYNERNRLYYKRKSMDDGAKKDAITEEIIKVTDKIKNVKRELFYYDDIVERTNEVVKNIKYIEEEKWKKKKNKNKENNGKNVR